MKLTIMGLAILLNSCFGVVENTQYIQFKDGSGYYVEDSSIYLEKGEKVLVVGDYLVTADGITDLTGEE